MSNNKKQNFLIKNKLDLERLNNDSLYSKVLKKINEGNEQKASFKYTLLNPKDKRDKMVINHAKSEHAMGIQKSQFIAVDNDVTHMQKFAQMEEEEL